MADRDLAEILESDDELPSNYDDDSEGRAYLDDHRFDTHTTNSSVENIKDLDDYSADEDEEDAEPKLKSHIDASMKTECFQFNTASKTEPETKALHSTDCSGKINTDNLKLVQKGILSKRDIFCLKCVADLSTDTTILWFINFLIQKDMQNNYKFLKSCLVNDVFDKILTEEKCSTMKTHNYYVVVSR